MTGLAKLTTRADFQAGDLACVGVDIVTIGQYLRPTMTTYPSNVG